MSAGNPEPENETNDKELRMKKTTSLCAIIVWSVLILPLFAFQNETTPPGDERPSGKHHGRSAERTLETNGSGQRSAHFPQ